MKIRNILLMMVLALFVAFAAPGNAQTAHAEDGEWSNGSIKVEFGYASEDLFRDSTLYPRSSSMNWGSLPYYSGGSAELIDSDNETVDSFSGHKIYEFNNLKAGTYTLRLTIPTYFYLVPYFIGGSESTIIREFETPVTVREGGSQILKRAVVERKAQGFETRTSIGEFKNGTQSYVYYKGGNSWYYDEKNDSYMHQHDGFYYGDSPSRYRGMNYLEIPKLSDDEKAKGYYFKGWDLVGDDSDEVYRESQALAHIVKEYTVFEAVWGYPTHKISFRSNLDYGSMDGKGKYEYTIDYDNQNITDIPQVTAKEGYKFVGWYQDLTTNVIPEDEIKSTPVTENQIFYAKFVKDEGSGNNDQGGNVTDSTDQTDYSDSEVTNIRNNYVYNSYTYNYNSTSYTSSVVGAKEADFEKAVLGAYDDGDHDESTFGRLKARGIDKGKNKLLIRWTKTSGAVRYVLYGNRCNHGGKKYYYKKIGSFGKGTTKYLAKKVRGMKLKKGTYYKFKVAAIDKDGNVIAVSKTVHATTAGGKYGNDKAVKKISPKSSKVTIKAGKSKKLRVKEITGRKKVSRHRAVAWESSNTKVATVKKGKVVAKSKGKCKIWAYAQNGVYTTYTIVVK